MEFTFDFVAETKRDVFRSLIVGLEQTYGGAVEGDVAEFGTMTGQTAQILAFGIAGFENLHADFFRTQSFKPRSLFLFDSFQGLPACSTDIDLQSPHVLKGVWHPGSCRGISPTMLQQLCQQHLPADRVQIHPGWFKDTLPLLPPETSFALVHIDCDLYESTIQVLEVLFQKNMLADGCVIFFDDWMCNRGNPEFGEQRAWKECVAKFAPLYTDCGEYGSMGRKFVVHKKSLI